MRKERITRADISDAQQTAARLFVQQPDWSKEQIAEGAGVSRTALYGWLRDSRFINLIEQYQSNPRLSLSSPEDIVDQLDEEAKLQLLSQLEAAERDHPKRSEIIEKEIARLEKRLQLSSENRRKIIRNEIEKLVGRLIMVSSSKENIFYNANGSLKPLSAKNFQALGEDLEELAIISRVLDKKTFDEAMLPARFAFAIAACLEHDLPVDDVSC